MGKSTGLGSDATLTLMNRCLSVSCSIWWQLPIPSSSGLLEIAIPSSAMKSLLLSRMCLCIDLEDRGEEPPGGV